MTIFEKVAEILAQHTDTALEEIKLESSFEDMGLDSLDIVDLVMTMEEAFDIKIELNEPVKTVGGLVKIIESLQQ
ncbi:Acyl carrier protein [bioreactor metagenome]|uniref:Acyl carrier protein n=1 Tax=bioreactor metagenome TaxID=1076179 RepID=A0A645HEA2_9ZZZZ